MKWLINKFLSAGDKAIFNNDLARRTASDKILRDKAFKIAKNAKYDGYQRGLA